jgi:hypothetical protein
MPAGWPGPAPRPLFLLDEVAAHLDAARRAALFDEICALEAPGLDDRHGAGTAIDVAAICALSALVPLVGNLALGASLGQVRALLASPAALRRMNRIAGALLIAVGAVLARGALAG